MGARVLTRCGLNTVNFERLAAGKDSELGTEQLCKRCFNSRNVTESDPIEFAASRERKTSVCLPSKQVERLSVEMNGGEADPPTLAASDDDDFFDLEPNAGL